MVYIEVFMNKEVDHDSKTVSVDTIFQMKFKYSSYYNGPFDYNDWESIHAWCTKSFGSDHYTWVGFTFWFETEEARNWFALRWGNK